MSSNTQVSIPSTAKRRTLWVLLKLAVSVTLLCWIASRANLTDVFESMRRADLRWLALAACIQSSRTLLTPEQLDRLETPALVAVGTKDDIAGSATGLATMLPNGSAFDIERRDHMLAVGDASFKRRALEFLADQNA